MPLTPHYRAGREAIFVAGPIGRRASYASNGDGNGKHLCIVLLHHGAAADLPAAAGTPARREHMLVCYLDDSGKDPQNSITTLAGYIARDTQWEAFKSEVEHWFKEFGVRVLHAKELHDTDEDFKGWTVLKKQAFVSRVCQARPT
jgi:hypothetical protein